MKKVSLIISLFLISITSQAQTIYLLKQWHLPPKVETSDIELAKKLSQYQNQKDLFEKIQTLIAAKKIQSVLSEGCERVDIDEKFKTKFNGWDYEKLEKLTTSKIYPDILTLLPLKVEALYKEKIRTLCVDDLDLIHQSDLALSDIRAYVGYSTRLSEFKKEGDQANYDRYATSILTDDEKKKNVDALQIVRKKASEAILLFQSINAQREQKLVKNILDLKMEKNQAAALVIGGIHVESLEVELSKHKMAVEIYTPKGYVENDKGLIDDIKRKLQ